MFDKMQHLVKMIAIPEEQLPKPANAGSCPSSPAIPPNQYNNTATPTPSHGQTDTTGSSTDPSKLTKPHHQKPPIGVPPVQRLQRLVILSAPRPVPKSGLTSILAL